MPPPPASPHVVRIALQMRPRCGGARERVARAHDRPAPLFFGAGLVLRSASKNVGLMGCLQRAWACRPYKRCDLGHICFFAFPCVVLSLVYISGGFA